MKGLLFFGFLLIVLFVASYGLQKEGFVNPGSTESLKTPQVIIPQVNPKPAPLEVSSPAPYLPPVEKEYGPAFGEVSRVNTLPYKDPTLESAPYARLKELLESMKGFFTFEAKSLETKSDPAIQLPLTTARGDLQRLTDELNVLNRNPGINSSLTQGQADEIQANLAYLQRQNRLSVNSVSGRSDLLEGFSNLNRVQPRLNVKQVKEYQSNIDTEIARLNATPNTTDPLVVNRLNTLRDYRTQLEKMLVDAPIMVIQPFGDYGDKLNIEINRLDSTPTFIDPLVPERSSTLKDIKSTYDTLLPGAPTPTMEAFTNPQGSGPRLTVDQVKTLIQRVTAEMARLSGSATTDPIVNARIETLRSIKNNLQGIVEDVESRRKTPESIPIFKSDMDKFLPVMGRPTEPLPDLIRESGLADYEAASKKVLDQILNKLDQIGLSMAAKPKDKVFMTAGSQAPGSTFVAFPRGEMESATATLEVNRLENRNSPAGKPAKVDWRKKSAEICEQIRKRGLNPKDFGCMDPSKVVSQDFSWRGNARMVCTRLLTTPDPGLPETCGCPPLDWPGWRS